MKKIAFLFSIVTFIACSESENDIAMVDSGAILAEESSSSAIEQSSAEKMVLSSSSATSISATVSSSSSNYMVLQDSLQTEINPCGSPNLATKRNYNPYELLVSGRVSKLVSSGLSTQDAENKAKQELYKTMGLDSLFDSSSFYKYSIEDAINFVFLVDSSAKGDFVQSFSETGTLNRLDFCGIWKDIPWTIDGYEVIEMWARNVGIRGCVYSMQDVEEPYLIFNNIHRKCIDLPYCDDKLIGSVKYAGLENVINDTSYVCTKRGWTVLENYDLDVKDSLCNEIGKIFKSGSVKDQFYVCKEDGWNVTTKLAYETKDIPCDEPLKLVVSPTDSTVFYLCKDSKWKIANRMEIETNKIPCDRVGKIFEGEFREYEWSTSGTFYICRDSGWDIASKRDVDIGERVCDVEGKTIQGQRDSLMYYVCYKNAWTDFYETPCDSNNKRMRASENGRFNEYICYNGKWHYSVDWTCEYPKDYYFNPDIEYGTLVDERDGETYRTVDVNGRIWMAENLRLVTDASQSVPFDDNCEIAGRFYSAGAAQTACPAGWRLPDTTDLNAFFPPDFDNLSGYMMSAYLEQFVSEIGNHCNGYGCNTYGTTILALGVYDVASEKMNALGMSHYWVYGDRNAKNVKQMHFHNSLISYREASDSDFLPIRCVKE